MTHYTLRPIIDASTVPKYHVHSSAVRRPLGAIERSRPGLWHYQDNVTGITISAPTLHQLRTELRDYFARR